MPTMTILFTDVARAPEQLVEAGDIDGVAHMSRHLRLSREIVEAHDGSVVKTLPLLVRSSAGVRCPLASG